MSSGPVTVTVTPPAGPRSPTLTTPEIAPVVGANVTESPATCWAAARSTVRVADEYPSRSNVSVYWPGVGSVRTANDPTSSSVRVTVLTSVSPPVAVTVTPPSGPDGLCTCPDDDTVPLAHHDLDALEVLRRS